MVAFAAQASDGAELPFLNPPQLAPAGDPVNESAQRWFVELSGVPTADGGRLSSVRAEKQAFRKAALAAGIRITEHYAYDTLFNGLSVSVDSGKVGALGRIAGVKAIYPVETLQVPETDPIISPDLFTALSMTGADVVQNDLGLDGTGIKVAVMDTGLDIDHPDFGGNGADDTTAFPTARVVAGYDLVGDAFNADSTSASYNPIPTPDANPDDCAGHGSHVAGIVGANGVVKGVAPGVTFGAYRVFGCAGSTFADIMLSAMERALADDMDVLNMSIGSTYQWPQYPTAAGATRLVNQGMVVVASAGNSGATGMYSTGAPSVGEKVISVASFDNTHARQRVFTISPDDMPIGYNQVTASPTAPTSGTVPLQRTGTKTTANDACNAVAPPAGSLTGKIALIRRGTCGFYEKARNAQIAGAVAAVLYDNIVAAPPNFTVAGTPPVTIPVVGIVKASGELIDDRLALGPVDLTWTNTSGSFPNAVGGFISSFSAFGLSPDLSFKPDVGAPGGSIYSTYPIELGSYAIISGTSMSSPHVAGAAALLLQSAPNTSSQAVRSILQNTARPKAWSGNPSLGLLEHAHRQGAGMLRIDDAITTATRVTPGKLSLGESEAGPSVNTLTLENKGGAAVTYTLSHAPAVATGANTFSLSAFGSYASAGFSAPTVTVNPGSTATVDVTITAPGTSVGGQYGGYVVLTPDDGSAVLRVPYAGYIGDYQARQVLVPTANGFPWLAKTTNGSSFSNRPLGETFTMAGFDMPNIAAHFDHQSRLIRFEIIGTDGKAWHRAFPDLEYFGRNSTATGFFAFAWDGTTVNGKKTQVVPNGTYRIQMSVLKANGDNANPAHWETFTSPIVTVARP